MNFGDILDEWDRETAKPYGKKKLKEENRQGRPGESRAPAGGVPPEPPRANPLDVWLRRYGVQDKDGLPASPEETGAPAERRRRLHAMKPEAVIDLHGLTRDEAWARLESFVADCLRQGYRKILVIHGKGTHSEDNPVLKEMVRLFVERNPHAGESGSGGKEAGGSGSTWILLK